MQFEGNKVRLKVGESQEGDSSADVEGAVAGSGDLQKPELGERYSVLSLIGRGGMASVYKIYDKTLGKTFAAKVMSPEHATEPVALKRFADEAEAAASMTHGNIAAVYSHGVTSGNVPFLFMDYLEGETLSAILEREGKLDPDRALGLFQQICEALIHAHMKGVIHRDLKPANIFISRNDEGTEVVKLVDFGIAKLQYREDDSTKLTQTGALIGSPFYMSPEQCRGESQDARSDVYALGCVMYHALNGKTPFAGPNSVKIILQHVKEPVPSFEMETGSSRKLQALEATVRKCLEKDPAQRYQSAGELLAELHSLESKKPNLAVAVEARPAPVRRLVASVIDSIVLTFLAHIIGFVFVHVDAAMMSASISQSQTVQSLPVWQAASILAYCKTMAPWVPVLMPLFLLSSLIMPPIFLSMILLTNSIPFYGSYGACVLLPVFPLIFLIYSAVFESSPLQGTLGKKLMGLVVLDCAGKRIGFRQAVMRSLLKWLTPIILFKDLAVHPICRDFKLPVRNVLATYWQIAKFFPLDDVSGAYVVRHDSRPVTVNRSHYDPSPNLPVLKMMLKRWQSSLQPFIFVTLAAGGMLYVIAPSYFCWTMPVLAVCACIPYVELWRRIRRKERLSIEGTEKQLSAKQKDS